MINFIYGNAGSGKTTVIFKQILEDAKNGENVILLVPEQQVLSSERDLAAMDGSAIPMNIQVLSFRRLANTVFRAEGGLRYDYVSRAQKTVLLWRAMMSVAPALKKYNATTLKDRGFLSEAVSCLEEFKAYRITPAALESAAEKLQNENKELGDKIGDLALCYAAYNETLARGYNDPSDDLEVLIGILECSDFLNDYKVYVDSFNGYTAVELELIRLIFHKAQEVCVSIGYDRTDSIAFASIANSDRALRRLAKETGKTINENLLDKQVRFLSDELSYLSRNLWDFSAKPYPAEINHIKLVKSHDIYTECEYIARTVKQGIRNGARYRDYAVIVRDTTAYDGILDAMFERYEIPCFLAKRTDITEHPAIKCVISALSVLVGGWQTDDVISYLKCGYSGIDADLCNILENYVTGWGITGKRWYDEFEWNMNPAGYSDTLKDSDAELLKTVNSLRLCLRAPLLALSEAFHKECTVKDATTALWSFIDSINLRQQIGEESAPVWNCLLNALDGMVHCAPDMTLSPEVYRDLLLTLLAESDIGRIPESNDSVTVGDASLLRLHKVEHVFTAGVLEGDFPKSVGEGAILSDAEKKTLGNLGVALSGGAELQNAEELFFLWRAFSAPSKTLTVTYPLSTLAGDGLTPSIAVTRLKKLFPKLKVTDAELTHPLDLIEGYADSFEYTSRFRGSAIGDALNEIYSSTPEYAARLAALERPIENIENSVSETVARTIWKDNINLTQARLDTFNNCAFSYYCKYVLKLGEERTPGFAISDIGNFVHMLLERFMQHICQGDQMRTDITESERDEIIDRLIDDYICGVFRDKRAAPPRLLTLIDRLRRTAILLITDIIEEFKVSDFRPKFFELEIKNEKDQNSVTPYIIEAPDGTRITLYGKVDRLDTYKKGDDVYVRIVDYKTGTHDIKLSDVERGRNLQMLLYLFAVWKTNDREFVERIGAQNGKILPAGVMYYKIKMPEITVNAAPEKENLDKLLGEKLTRTGLSLDDEGVIWAANKDGGKRYSPGEMLSLEHFGALVAEVEQAVCNITGQMRSGNAKAEWKNTEKDPCAYCSMQPICRKGK